MSGPSLSRISDLMDAQVEAGEISGTVTAVAIDGRTIHFAVRSFQGAAAQPGRPGPLRASGAPGRGRAGRLTVGDSLETTGLTLA